MKQQDITMPKDLYSRAVSEFIDTNNDFKTKLEKRIKGEYTKDIIIKFGVDPTRPDIHIGHAVILRKLRQFQELGCKVVFLVGDFTAQIGDPTGKSKVRPELDQKTVEANMKSYLDQVGNILLIDKEHFSWVRNSHWFTSVSDIVLPPNAKLEIGIKHDDKETKIPMAANSFIGKAFYYQKHNMQITHLKRNEVLAITLRGILWTLRHITHSRLIARDMFQDRIAKGDELYMHEMLYPVLQGIDSNIICTLYGSCDLEIGGTDQTFNMLMGRDIMKINKQDQQAVMALELLEGTDGKEKMSKSLDNFIGITDEPNDMYGKIMSVPDSLLIKYFKLCSYTPEGDIEQLEKDLQSEKENPRDVKMRLAREIVSIYHGEESSKNAEEHFINVFSNKKIPENIDELKLLEGEKLIDAITREEILASRNDFRRMIKDGAIKLLGEEEVKITDVDYIPEQGNIFKIGKKRFIKTVI